MENCAREETVTDVLQKPFLAQVGIQAPGLCFRCICHLGNPIKTRFESGFCLLCTSHGPCCLSPHHQVWEDWLYWFVSALRGGLWSTQLGRHQPRAGLVGRPSRALTSLCLIFYPPEEKRKRETALKMPLLPCLDIPAGFLGVTRRTNSRRSFDAKHGVPQCVGTGHGGWRDG